jgi:formylglycine-generating enzyme required for sulfatase activity
VERLLLKVLARNPADRYASMGEFGAALETALSGNAAPARQQPAQPRERRVDTQAIVNQMEGSTIKETPAPRVPATQTIAPSNSSGLLRYWPLALIGILLVGALSIGLYAALFPPPRATATPETPAPVFTQAPPATNLSPTAAPADPEEMTDAKGVSMRLVPAGSFSMGSNVNDDEKPIHDVYLDSYWMDKTEVTNEMFAGFVENTDYITDAEKSGSSYVAQKWDVGTGERRGLESPARLCFQYFRPGGSSGGSRFVERRQSLLRMARQWDAPAERSRMGKGRRLGCRQAGAARLSVGRRLRRFPAQFQR